MTFTEHAHRLQTFQQRSLSAFNHTPQHPPPPPSQSHPLPPSPSRWSSRVLFHRAPPSSSRARRTLPQHGLTDFLPQAQSFPPPRPILLLPHHPSLRRCRSLPPPTLRIRTLCRTLARIRRHSRPSARPYAQTHPTSATSATGRPFRARPGHTAPVRAISTRIHIHIRTTPSRTHSSPGDTTDMSPVARTPATMHACRAGASSVSPSHGITGVARRWRLRRTLGP